MADAIREHRVTVNGAVVEDFRYPVNTQSDRIQVNDKVITIIKEKPVCLVLNKPAGVLSTTKDERGRKTVLDLLPGKYKRLRLYPVGRLDIDTTGLLLLTNDGGLTNLLTHPRYEHEKEYYIKIEGKLTDSEKRTLERGVRLDDGVTSAAVVKEIKGVPSYNYSLIIHEGRKRQVRRMFAHLGRMVLALKRVRTGNLSLGNLKEGEVRELSPREVASLLER
jgi:23S rRNA pseudouridine2605 synthase